MKSRLQPSMWIIRIMVMLILTFGGYRPVFAADLPDLVSFISHVGDFAQGENDKVYTIEILNSGDGATDGSLMTLTDTIPTGLIPQSIVGDSGWTCPTGDISALSVLTCTRSTPLAAHTSTYITLTVDVAVNAGQGAKEGVAPDYYRAVTNQVNVTGGGDLDVSNTADDYTKIFLKPDVRITGYEFLNEAKEVITNLLPDQSFYIRMTIENRGGLDSGSFYPGIFLDGEPNYGPDHDEPTASPVPLIWGETTNFADYRISDKGCFYYDPNELIPTSTDIVNSERGNYSLLAFIPSIPAESTDTAEVLVGYPSGDGYGGGSQWEGLRDGLSAGAYTAYLYADTSCNVANESYEDNNSYGPIPLNITTNDGGDTVGIFRPSNATFYLRNTNSAGTPDITKKFGLPGDYPVVGDWNGDGVDTIGVYRNGVFYLSNSNTSPQVNITFAFGKAGDQPIAGDWDGDGIDTVGVYRTTAIAFLLRNSNSAGTADMIFKLGKVGDVAVAGDWNFDGKDTTGVFRPSNGIIYLKNANTTGFADIFIYYGIKNDKPVTADWDDDGIDTFGVHRSTKFYLRNTNTVGYADIWFDFGVGTDMPVAGNWDGVP